MTEPVQPILVEIIVSPAPTEVVVGIPGPPGPSATDAFDIDLVLLYEIAKL